MRVKWTCMYDCIDISWPHVCCTFQDLQPCLGKTCAHFVLRCAVLAILKLHPCSMILLAPVCSSFSFMCSSVAMRFFFSPLGDESKIPVKLGNVMANRVVLLCWLCVSLGHTFILEQPGSAKFGDMPRWRFFCEKICYVTWFLYNHHLASSTLSIVFSCFHNNASDCKASPQKQRLKHPWFHHR